MTKRALFLTVAFFFTGLMTTTAHAASDDLRTLETRGTLTQAQDGQIAPNIWQGVTRDDALVLIRSLPDTYASPIYYDLARKFLLSDAPAFAPESKKKNLKKGEVAPSATRPDILIARIDKLLEMGALRDAQALYDAVISDIPSDFDLVYRNLEMLMLHGQLSAACLDLQAMQGQHGDNPKWKDFNAFCHVQFAKGADRDKLLAETKFAEFPKMDDFLRGHGFGNPSSLSTEELAFAVATGAISQSSISLLSPLAGKMRPLLLSVLLDMDTAQPMPQKTCLAIEAARRGLASTRSLISLYEKPHYDSELLLGTQDKPSAETANIHPCLIPTVLYQRVASNDETPLRDQTIRAAFDVMKDMPDAAFWPMAVYLRNFDIHAAVNKPYAWRVSRVLAYEKDALPDSWLTGWEQVNDRGEQGAGVAPYWPVQAIVAAQPNAKENLALWREQWPSEAKRIDSRDPVIPLLLGEVLAGKQDKQGKNPKSDKEDYENNFSLTFSRSYSMPSYGLTQRMASVIEKGQTGQSVALLLIGYGAIPPDQVFPHQMALVIEGMNKAGLARYARRFALEVLQ